MSWIIEDVYPGLRGKNYLITSPKDPSYNCIAWAAGQTGTWLWPNPFPGGKEFWPAHLERIESLSSIQKAFEDLGFKVCTAGEGEQGQEKIALFADTQGNPTHAARQLPHGRWTSKLGELEDIEHDLRDLEGDTYGRVVLVMKRQQALASKVPFSSP